jgi:chromosome segregation ATPase
LVRLNEEVISSRDYYAKEYKGVKSALKAARKRVTELDQEAKTLRARVDAMETERASLETEKISRENYIKDIVTVND